MSALAIILGRGGSKGLPRKNMLDVAGKPCVEWSIDAAKASRRVGSIALSSDDADMLALARAQGIHAIARPADLASDSARVDDAARHAVRALAECDPEGHALNTPRAPIVILYANVPVRPEGCVDRALDLLERTGCDSVQSYQPVGKHHPWWTARVEPDAGRVEPWEGEVLNHGVFRRQDLPPAFTPDGAVIALSLGALMLEIPGVASGPHAFFGRDRRGIINPEGSVVDIDSRLDLLVASAMLTQPSRAWARGS